MERDAAFQVLDNIVERSREAITCEALFSEEVDQRLRRALPTTDAECLSALAELVAYSQQANSDAVRKTIEAGNLRAAFGDFDVGRVAALDANAILAAHWRNMTVMRFKSKIKRIIGVAEAMNRLQNDGLGLREQLSTIPKRIQRFDDVDEFWKNFAYLKHRLRAVDMPFFRQVTSLLHLLLHFGFDCLKPDKIVQQVATTNGLLRAKPRPEDLTALVRLQEYSLSRAIRPAVVDLYLLIEGGQAWAKKFITCGNHAATNTGRPTLKYP